MDYVQKGAWKGCQKFSGQDDQLPLNYEYEECTRYWNLARNSWANDGHEPRDFDATVNKIKVISDCRNWVPECLNIELFRKHGWCYIEGGTIDEWSICDHSCKHVEVIK